MALRTHLTCQGNGVKLYDRCLPVTGTINLSLLNKNQTFPCNQWKLLMKYTQKIMKVTDVRENKETLSNEIKDNKDVLKEP